MDDMAGTRSPDAQLVLSGAQSQVRPKVIFAACVGTLIEFYDFTVYGYLAVAMGRLFFPSGDSAAATLSALAVFAIAFFVRPIGGLIFGHLGDRFGRRNVLSATILLMGVSTTAIGVLPTYAMIGIGATILVVVARMIQGAAAGGELGGALTFIAESVPPRKRAFLTSFTQFGSHGSAALGAIVVAIVTSSVTQAQLMSWAWRLPLLIALPMAAIGLVIRTKLADTPEFTTLREDGRVEKSPIRQTVREGRSVLFRIWGLITLQTMSGYFCITFLYIYFSQYLGFSARSAYWATVVEILIGISTLPLFGWLSDRWGRKPFLRAGAIGWLVLVYPMLALMGMGNYPLAIVCAVVLFTLNCAYAPSAFAVVTELLPTRFRYTGAALGINVPLALFGGSAPYASAWLIEHTGSSRSPAFMIGAAAILSLFTTTKIKETAGGALTG
ncbi:MFS transporter [Amycolatopsis thermoflava]|uniref:Putative proline/betaine transporter n=1 Tax=Amycolatopsis thermoflava TaxID=84480 RepID=A0A3N2GP59_9PSEU|nr:MFS transporter [Amycolatopsis thermoflava]ROS38424.1 MHS family proline/betaine transporter-like MFS transporter [Amycolatopsis thermoflava]